LTAGGPAGEDETAGADLDGIDGIDGIDGGEEAQVAMGDLFLAADRLQHVPWDKTLAADVRLAADAVTATLPPYGVEPAVWRRVQTMGGALAQSASEDIIDDGQWRARQRPSATCCGSTCSCSEVERQLAGR